MGFFKKTGGVCALVHFLSKRKQCGDAQHGPWAIWHIAGVSAVAPGASGVDQRHPVWAQTRARSLRYRLCLTHDVGGTLLEVEADIAPAHCCALAPLSRPGRCPLCSGLLLFLGTTQPKKSLLGSSSRVSLFRMRPGSCFWLHGWVAVSFSPQCPPGVPGPLEDTGPPGGCPQHGPRPPPAAASPLVAGGR